MFIISKINIPLCNAPMDQVIRHEDGSLISTLEWNTIMASACLIKHKLRLISTPTDRRAQSQPKTKVYYRTFHTQEWMHAVQHLEEEQLLLKLCTSHWKAEHVLNISLMNGRHDGNTNGNNCDGSDNSTKKKKLPASPHQKNKK